VLDGVIDMTGRTTFRECAGLIGEASLFLSTEGGLVHAAQAMQTKSVVVITGYQHPDMVAYPQNVNLWINEGHGPCGMKVPCAECESAVCAHDAVEIATLAMGAL
jgi:ADP-heptose:LPS heptosyltransferase